MAVTQPMPFHDSLSSGQQRRMESFALRESNRETARWWRTSLQKVATLGQGAEGVYVTSVQVEGHEEREGVTYFRLRLRAKDGSQWHVLHRYSDFDSLRNELGVKDKRVGSVFPQKTWFTCCTGPELEKRRQILQIWLDGLMAEFSAGGDGRHTLLPFNRSKKLATLHSFLGVDAQGRMLPNARLLPSATPAAPALVAQPGEDGVIRASAPPMEVASEDAAEAPMALSEEEQYKAALAESLATHASEEEARRKRDAEATDALKTLDVVKEQETALLEKQKSDDEELVRRLAEEEAEEEAMRRTEVEAMSKADAWSEEVRRIVRAEEARQKAVAEEAMRRAEEEARQKALEEVARLAAEEELRRKAEEEEARHLAEEEQARRQAEEEEARRKAEEEAIRAAEEQARRETEAEARRRAEEKARQRAEEEENARRQAEEEEARRKAEEAEEAQRLAVEVAARRKAEEEEEARRKAEVEEARRKAEEEEEARRKAEAQDAARRKAEEFSKKPLLEQAMILAGEARQMEDNGQLEEALGQYKQCLSLFTLAQRKEKGQKIRNAIQVKITDFTGRINQLSDVVQAADAARVAELLGGPSQEVSLQSRVDALLAFEPSPAPAQPAPASAGLVAVTEA